MFDGADVQETFDTYSARQGPGSRLSVAADEGLIQDKTNLTNTTAQLYGAVDSVSLCKKRVTIATTGIHTWVWDFAEGIVTSVIIIVLCILLTKPVTHCLTPCPAAEATLVLCSHKAHVNNWARIFSSDLRSTDTPADQIFDVNG